MRKDESDEVAKLQKELDNGFSRAQPSKMKAMAMAFTDTAQDQNPAASHAEARRAALAIRKAQTQRRKGAGPDSAIHNIPVVKGPILCHQCQLKCVDAEHYLTHTCVRRRAG